MKNFEEIKKELKEAKEKQKIFEDERKKTNSIAEMTNWSNIMHFEKMNAFMIGWINGLIWVLEED